MVLHDHVAPEGSGYQRLKILMLARVLIVTLLLGVSALIEMSKGDSLLIPSNNSLYLLMGFTCLLSIIYALALRRITDLRRFAYGQILLDVIFITLLVYLTGGIQSLFPLAYILSIVSAGLVLSRQGTYVIASISSALYAASLSLDDIDKTEIEMELETDLDIIFPVEKELVWNTFGELKKMVEVEFERACWDPKQRALTSASIKPSMPAWEYEEVDR
jgi:hypothetical protein